MSKSPTKFSKLIWLALFSLASTEASSATFGSSGSSGRSGYSGNSGSSGSSQSHIITGQKVIYSEGQDGGNGSDGHDGQDAYCPSQPRRVSYNLYGADGGNGGSGGDGGRGGNGGIITLYSNSISNLGKITVKARGGNGGSGGDGAYGGYGCDCQYHSWEIRTCNSNQECTYRTYHCYDGDNGRNGRDGSYGRDGQNGKIRFVPQTTLLQRDNPTRTARVESFKEPTLLTKNVWEEKYGAKNWLASGSVVQDNFDQFVERLEQRIQINWKATYPLSRFPGLNASVELQSNRKFDVDFGDDVWVVMDQEVEGDLTTVNANEAIKVSDVTKLKSGGNQGSKSETEIIILDLGGKAKLLNTSFHMKISGTKRNRPNRMSKLFEGEVPAELVSRQNNRFLIKIGQLDLDTSALKKGKEVRLEIKAKRSLGRKSKTQELLINRTIR